MRYFIVTYYKKPTGKINESVKLDTKVRDRDLRSASVIIDYRDRKIVKSNFEEELGPDNQHDFDTINNFYKQHYPDMIAQLEAKYEVIQAALDLASEMVEEIKESKEEVTGESLEEKIEAKIEKAKAKAEANDAG